jgi:hypothetical protein
MNTIRYITIALCGLSFAARPAAAQNVDTIRVGTPSLAAAELELGSYTMLSVQRVDGEDTPISTTTLEIRRERTAARDTYVILSRHMSADGDTTVGELVVSADDFALIHHRVKGLRDSAVVAATPTHLTGWVVLPDEPIRLIDEQRDAAVFPVEGQVPWLLHLLPLQDGYAAAIPHYSQWAGQEEWDLIRVVGEERVTLDGGEYDCWKVDGGELFPGYGVTYWVDKHTRRIVQGVARSAGGGPEYWSWVQAAR